MGLEKLVVPGRPSSWSIAWSYWGGPAILASPELCLVLQPQQARALRVAFAGDFPLWLWNLTESLVSMAKARQAPSHSDTQGWHWVLGIVTSAVPHTQVTIPPSPWPVGCIGQWPGHRGPSWGGWQVENTLASSVMSAKRAELKKTNLVKEKLDRGGLSSQQRCRSGVGDAAKTPMHPWLFFLCSEHEVASQAGRRVGLTPGLGVGRRGLS